MAVLLNHDRSGLLSRSTTLLRKFSLKRRAKRADAARQMSFPAELEDMIIDHLKDDKKALANCSLVCQSWRPRSRYHLFSTVSLELSREDGEERARRFSMFLGLNPHVRTYLRNLHLAGDVSPIPVTHMQEGILAGVLERLPRLETLTMHSFQLVAGTDIDCGGDTPCTSPGLDIFEVISRLSYLRTLGLRDFFCDEHEDDSSPKCAQLQTRMRMEELQLQNISIPQGRLAAFLDRVTVLSPAAETASSAPRGDCLRHLTFPLEHRGFRGINAIDNFDICGHLIQHVGPSVEHLVFDLWGVQGIAGRELVPESKHPSLLLL